MNSSHRNPYFKIGITAFSVIALSILFFFSLFRLASIFAVAKTLLSALSPFIIGFTLAYLLLPVFGLEYRFLLPHCIKVCKTEQKAEKLAKFFSALGAVGFLLVLLSTLLSLVLPSLVSSIVGLTDSMESYLIIIQEWINPLIADNAVLQGNFQMAYEEFSNNLTSWVQGEMLPQMILLMSGGLMSTFNFITDMIVGIIITVYMLYGKDTFKAQSKKATYALFKPDVANMILHNMRFTHRVFGGFITGKIIDSLIIGVICFVCLSLLKMPYVMLISVILGITNIIPFFGPFIGAIPSALLVLIVDPIKCVYFVIFVIILQQFDGNILGPKILGDSTGLSSFWVMFAIITFGGVLGFTGMVIGVPLFAVIYSAISAVLSRRLRSKNMPEASEVYLNVDHIDEVTGNLVPVEKGRAMPQSVKISRKKEGNNT